MSGRFYPTRFDVESPDRMERTLRLVFDAIYRLGDADLGIKQTALAEVAKLGESLSAPKITTALSAVGPAPLNVEGLLGQLAQPQKAGAPSVSALPDVLLAQDGELVFFDQQLYRFDATTEPGTWTAVTVRIVPLEDAVTNAVSTVLTLIHTSTGAVAAGFGAGLLYKLEDAAGATQSAGSLDILWEDAGATQDAAFSVRLMATGAAIAEAFHGTSTGELQALLALAVGGLGTANRIRLIGTPTGVRALTLPDTTDTLVAKATTDVLTNKTYDTAGVGNVLKINGTQITAITGTGAAVLADSPTFTTKITTPRVLCNGTAVVAGDFALSAGWGDTASVSVTAGSNDMRGQITVTANGAGIGGNPSVTLTFKDGTFTTIPFSISKMNGGTGTMTNVIDVTTATTLLISFRGTPVAGSSYIFRYVILG